MNPKYKIWLYCIKEHLTEANSQLKKSVQDAGLVDKVDIFHSTLTFVDHGQNPLADARCGGMYIRVKSPQGEEIFQKSALACDTISKTIPRDFQDYVQRTLNVIQENLKVAS
tara:strand:+ start:833 stop:1168 length:336 start_codon:yes stop_codon:yes gene_type:complete